jgi:ribosome-interacting GTPase 1
VPANLPPQYLSAEKKLRQTKDPREKIAILEEMWSLLPKHKGTDKIQADIKRRISRFKKSAETAGKRGKGFSLKVVREGAGQVVLLGPPNSGKSSLVALLSSAAPKIAPYPFTTALPYPAMMPYEDVQVQLVDLPPVASGHLEFWTVNIIRNADAVLLVADASDERSLDMLEEVISELERRMIGLGAGYPPPEKEQGYSEKVALLLCNKMDAGDAPVTLELIRGLYSHRFKILPFSCTNPDEGSVERVRASIFELLDVIRVYSKEPGKKLEPGPPFTIKRGATVLEFSAHVHKDFAAGLKQARVWGSARFDGQAVSRDHVLQDGDIVELSV